MHEPEKVGGRWESRWGLLAEDVKDHLGGRRENPGRRGCKLGRHRCRKGGERVRGWRQGRKGGVEKRTEGHLGSVGNTKNPDSGGWSRSRCPPIPPTSLPLPLPPPSLSLLLLLSGWRICHGQILSYLIDLGTRTWTDPRFPRCLRPFVALRPPHTISALSLVLAASRAAKRSSDPTPTLGFCRSSQVDMRGCVSFGFWPFELARKDPSMRAVGRSCRTTVCVREGANLRFLLASAC